MAEEVFEGGYGLDGGEGAEGLVGGGEEAVGGFEVEAVAPQEAGGNPGVEWEAEGGGGEGGAVGDAGAVGELGGEGGEAVTAQAGEDGLEIGWGVGCAGGGAQQVGVDRDFGAMDVVIEEDREYVSVFAGFLALGGRGGEAGMEEGSRGEEGYENYREHHDGEKGGGEDAVVLFRFRKF